MALKLLALFASLLLGQAVELPKVFRLELADCDDVAFGPKGDLFFACHSPNDRLKIAVRGARPVADVMDGYVLRLNPKNGKVVFATRLGGASHDAAFKVRVDRRGWSYVTGVTYSADFPTTAGAFQTKLTGKSDGFLVILKADGEVAYSTLIGGSGDELGNGLDIDEKGDVYFGGVTSSRDFPGQKATKTSSDDDAFVCHLRYRANTVACQIFGGTNGEKLTDLVLDKKGGIYATGYSSSADFPMKMPLQDSLQGSGDAFLTRLSVMPLQISSSTLLGGSGDDSAWSIGIDNLGNPVIAGITESDNFPGAAGRYQSVRRGKKDAFVSVVRAAGIRTTYFGGSSNDESGYDGGSVKVDRAGNIWLAGMTYSDDLPTRNATQPQFGGGNGDGFVAKFGPKLDRLCFASYFGDAKRNLLEGIAISSAGLVAATGVSFTDAPSPLQVQIGSTNLYAGHYVAIWKQANACGE